MGIIYKIKEWYDEKSIEGIQEFKKYVLKVTLVDDSVIEMESNGYYNISCSFSEYAVIGKDRGLRINGKLYPWHMIKHVEDYVIAKELVMIERFAYGLGGIDIFEIKLNQDRNYKIIEKYKKIKGTY